ncbi:MAG: hypothetical protein HY699_11410 [Deltaproteobacteria bacterium]|nr:hypothetical protein [Deltaproteobacteria bacterium]
MIDDIRRDLTLQHYDEVRERLTGVLSGDARVLAVGAFGAVTHPGISDLDVLVVARNGEAAGLWRYLKQWIAGDAVASYLFTHPPLVVSAAMIPALGHVHALAGLHWQYRHEQCPLPPPLSGAGMEYLDLIYASFLLPGAAKLLGDGSVRLRFALLSLNGLHLFCEKLSGMLGASARQRRRSGSIRRLVLKLPPADPRLGRLLGAEYRRAVRQLCDLMNQVGETAGAPRLGGLPRCLPRRDTALIVPAATTAFQRHLGYVRLQVHAGVFRRLLAPWYAATVADAAAIEYQRAHQMLLALGQQEQIPPQFVTPFGYPCGQTGLESALQIATWKAILAGKQLVSIMLRR